MTTPPRPKPGRAPAATDTAAGKFLTGRFGGKTGTAERQAAKATIERDLAKRLAGRLDTDPEFRAWFGNHGNVRALKDGSFARVDFVNKTKSRMSPEAIDFELRTWANDHIRTWAHSSGDNNQVSVALQRTAQDLFGIADESLASLRQRFPATWENAGKLIEQNGAFYRAFLEEQYLATQQAFREAGITHVRLWRGMRPPSSGNIPKPSWMRSPAELRDGGLVARADDFVADRDVLLQPLSSFSSRRTIAEQFSNEYGHGVIMQAEIPVELIIGNARTGFGCLNEYEFVVLGNPGRATVHWSVSNLGGFPTTKAGGFPANF